MIKAAPATVYVCDCKRAAQFSHIALHVYPVIRTVSARNRPVPPHSQTSTYLSPEVTTCSLTSCIIYKRASELQRQHYKYYFRTHSRDSATITAFANSSYRMQRMKFATLRAIIVAVCVTLCMGKETGWLVTRLFASL